MRRSLPVVLFLILAAGCGGSDDERPDAKATSGATAAATSTATATTTARTSGDCSAGRLKTEGPEKQGIPDAAAETRSSIIKGARGCEYGDLETLALAGDESFNYSFGEPTDPDEGEPAQYWENQEDDNTPVLETLVRLLRLRPAKTSNEEERVFVWPAAAAGDRPSDKQREAVERAFRDEDVDAWFVKDGYVGPRVGITADGDWLYYVAGGD